MLNHSIPSLNSLIDWMNKYLLKSVSVFGDKLSALRESELEIFYQVEEQL